MKKILFACAVISVFGLILTACGDKAKPNPGATRSEAGTLPKTEPSTTPSSAPDSHLHPIIIDGIRLNFIDLPAVTDEEVVLLQQALSGVRNGLERTSIVAMPAFRAAEAKTSIGLYHAVMGEYPDVVGCFSFELNGNFTPDDAQSQYREWDANPDLPLVCTTVAQNIAFAERLSQVTGRRLSIMSDPQNEYSIRGRVINEDGSWGAITSTRFHFGDESQVRYRAFIRTNPLTENRAHGVHEIPDGLNGALYRNSFGLIHPIGNVCSRSIEGPHRGGSFNHAEWVSASHSRIICDRNIRAVHIGSRLAEAIAR